MFEQRGLRANTVRIEPARPELVEGLSEVGGSPSTGSGRTVFLGSQQYWVESFTPDGMSAVLNCILRCNTKLVKSIFVNLMIDLSSVFLGYSSAVRERKNRSVVCGLPSVEVSVGMDRSG
jgi:hypothetical protein